MTYLEELRKYFETTPPEKVLQEFAKYDVEENNVGPTVNEFLISCQHYYPISYCPPDNLHIQHYSLSPRFYLGLFFYLFLGLKLNSFIIAKNNNK